MPLSLFEVHPISLACFFLDVITLDIFLVTDRSGHGDAYNTSSMMETCFWDIFAMVLQKVCEGGGKREAMGVCSLDTVLVFVFSNKFLFPGSNIFLHLGFMGWERLVARFGESLAAEMLKI